MRARGVIWCDTHTRVPRGNATAWRQEGWSALSTVAFTGFKGHVDIAVELLRLGADVHQRNDVRARLPPRAGTANMMSQAGQTALYVAAWNGQFDVATELLRVGADPVERDMVGTGRSSCVVALRQFGRAALWHAHAAAAAAAAAAYVSGSICVWEST